MACILLVSLFLQSCDNFSDSPIPVEEEQPQMTQIDNGQEIGKETYYDEYKLFENSKPSEEGVSNFLEELEENSADDRGNAEKDYKLGVAYYEGYGVPRDHEKAKVYFKKAADQGYESKSQVGQKRIKKELEAHIKRGSSSYSFQPVDVDLCRWIGKIIGPENTPYAGGIFFVNIELPTEYPFKAPKVVFKTPIFHPNIIGNSQVYIEGEIWAPNMTIDQVMSRILNYLLYPDTYSANTSPRINLEATELYDKDYQVFYDRAKEWTEKYAKQSNNYQFSD